MSFGLDFPLKRSDALREVSSRTSTEPNLLFAAISANDRHDTAQQHQGAHCLTWIDLRRRYSALIVSPCVPVVMVPLVIVASTITATGKRKACNKREEWHRSYPCLLHVALQEVVEGFRGPRAMLRCNAVVPYQMGAYQSVRLHRPRSGRSSTDRGRPCPCAVSPWRSRLITEFPVFVRFHLFQVACKTKPTLKTVAVLWSGRRDKADSKNRSIFVMQSVRSGP